MIEKLLSNLTYEELFFALTSLINNDCYVEDFFEEEPLEVFLELIEAYNLVYISSDNRVLLTPKGHNVLQNISQKVDLLKLDNKVNRNEYTKN